MIPYFQIPSLPIFDGVAIHPFGVLVATGILSGAMLTRRRGQQLGLDDDLVKNMIFWSVATGLLMAHFLDVLVYQKHPDVAATLRALADPRSGLSSMGGFFGAVLGLVVWCRRNGQKVLPYADSLAYGLALGLFFGRMGCYVAHDHPGFRTDFFLGVDYPCPAAHCPATDGFHIFTDPKFRRHDLGFYEVLVAGTLATFYAIADRFRPRIGFYVAAIALYYGPVRFLLDYLRVNFQEGGDPRWFALTPAQYAAIAVMLIGVALTVKVAKMTPAQVEAYRPSNGADNGAVPEPAKQENI